MNKKIFIVLTGILAILLLCGTFFDLQISQALYNPENLFAQFFYWFGQAPGMLLVSFGFMLILMARPKNIKWLSILLLLICGVCSFIYAALPLSIGTYYMGCGLSGRIAVLAVAVILYLLMLSGAKKIAEMNDPQTLIRIALTFILLYFVVGKILSFAKNLWGRPRFYSILDDFTRFSPWYRLLGNPLDDTFKSFPSGHASEGAMLIGIILLGKMVPALKKRSSLLYGIAFAWVLCVMTARISAGAHFLSDVTVGTFITFLIFFLLSALLVKDRQAEKTEFGKEISQ